MTHITERSLLLWIFIAFLISPTITMASTQSIGSVTRLKGTAFINNQQAVIGSEIKSQDMLRTDTDGRMQIRFIDGTELTVGGASSITVDDYVYSPDSQTPVENATLNFTSGAFRLITSKIVDQAPENFTVRTPLATIGIRGTSFWGGYLSNIEFDIVMLKGKGISVTSMGGTVLLDEAGQGVSVPDPQKHPQGFAKALLKPDVKKWGQAKLRAAIDTVDF